MCWTESDKHDLDSLVVSSPGVASGGISALQFELRWLTLTFQETSSEFNMLTVAQCFLAKLCGGDIFILLLQMSLFAL